MSRSSVVLCPRSKQWPISCASFHVRSAGADPLVTVMSAPVITPLRSRRRVFAWSSAVSVSSWILGAGCDDEHQREFVRGPAAALPVDRPGPGSLAFQEQRDETADEGEHAADEE